MLGPRPMHNWRPFPVGFTPHQEAITSCHERLSALRSHDGCSVTQSMASVLVADNIPGSGQSDEGGARPASLHADGLTLQEVAERLELDLKTVRSAVEGQPE